MREARFGDGGAMAGGAVRRAAALALALALASGCGSGMVRYPRRAIVWVDDDTQPFAPPPEPRWVPYYWDALDNLVFRPASEAWLLELDEPAIDVNALDEVPDSSFFENRIGRTPMSPEEVALGACDAMEIAPPAPWTVISGKPDGASPGLTIRAADGVRYVLKTDRPGQPEQSTAADAIAAAVFHAAGYHVPCNRVVLFDPSVLVLDPEASVSLWGYERPLTEDDVRFVVESAVAAPDGRRRVVLSRFVEGTPLGPWSYVGTWDADPNDVVPHEHRRELRGQYVLDAWLDHWDARQQNSLSTWIGDDHGGYVRHYLIDFGETIGMIRGGPRGAPRMGHATFLDLGQIAEDTLTLGIASRPWDARARHAVLGYYDAEHFDPEGWRPQYWNGALDRRTEGDAAWGARLLARFDDEHVSALVALGRFSDPAVARTLERILLARRDELLARYLGRLSPLADPEIDRAADGRARVCMVDLAVTSGVVADTSRMYRARVAHGPPVGVSIERPTHGRVCASFPDLRDPDQGTRYLVLELSASGVGPILLHFYALGSGRLELVGLRRPAP